VIKKASSIGDASPHVRKPCTDYNPEKGEGYSLGAAKAAGIPVISSMENNWSISSTILGHLRRIAVG